MRESSASIEERQITLFEEEGSNKPLSGPWDQEPVDKIYKPGELIDVVEITPMSLGDRRTLNMLIGYAGKKITENIDHTIPKAMLRTPGNESNNAVTQCLDRLHSAFVKIKVKVDDKPALRRIPIFYGSLEQIAATGQFKYRFHPALINIIRDSNQWGRLRKEVMFAFTSKYALALYELVQKRGELKYKWEETFTIEELRNLLGVDPKKLKRFANLNAWALQPAVQEVNALADYGVELLPLKRGKAVHAIKLKWWKKTSAERINALKELQNSKIGRKARIKKETEDIV
jgi:plasmid replication initiation protein